ncbi:MAG: hypothetical protein KC613_24765, partial [Myxococcales bacterium]|nr:hypothetical protein [Myxococcales bacterium]
MPDKSAAVNPRKASDDARAVLHSLPRDPARIQDIASAAGVRTRSTQAWVSCFAVLGRAQMHDVGR